jgi:hypothetical protein
VPTHSTRRMTSYRLTAETRDLIRQLKDRLGLSEAAVIELAVRRLARVELAEGRWPPSAVLDCAARILEIIAEGSVSPIGDTQCKAKAPPEGAKCKAKAAAPEDAKHKRKTPALV